MGLHEKVRPEINDGRGVLVHVVVPTPAQWRGGRRADHDPVGHVKVLRRWGNKGIRAWEVFATIVQFDTPRVAVLTVTAWPVARDSERGDPGPCREIIGLDQNPEGIKPLNTIAIIAVSVHNFRVNGRAPCKGITLNGRGGVFAERNKRRRVRERGRGGELGGLAGGGRLERGATKIFGKNVPAGLEIAVLVCDHVPRLERLGVGR